MCVFCNDNAMIEGDMIAKATRQHWTEKTWIGFGISWHGTMKFPKQSGIVLQVSLKLTSSKARLTVEKQNYA